MSTVFSKIIAGELPGRFVWQDPDVVAFLSIAPLRPGHALVVPRQEIDQWTTAEDGLFARCTAVAQHVGRAVQRVWDAPRVGLVVAGFEVPHVHLHVFPTWGMDDFDFGRADQHPDPAALDDAAGRIRAALRELGHAAEVPA
ncbi:HIT family protein [Dactylosporangium sp. NPDC051485]|uniref:HIT family protein n=1 Tax=Dactylosporangium sp. NPDC051485 TaxID=3154846 RepID=UPI00341714A5